MKRLHSALYLIIILLCLKCDVKREKRKDFNVFYLDVLKTLRDYREEGKLSPKIDIEKCYFFLSVMSGHESSRDGTNWGIMYIDEKDYKKDVKEWENWLIEHGDKLTMVNADSVFRSLEDKYKADAESWEEFFSNSNKVK